MLKTGINLSKKGHEYSTRDTLKCIRDAGFDCFFTETFDTETTAMIKETSEKLGLCYESVHAPFKGINCMWEEGPDGEEYVRRLCGVADLCARFEIAKFTLHCMNVPQINRDVTAPLRCSDLGLERFFRVVEYATRVGVKPCFENVEFPQFELQRILEHLRKKDGLTFGWTWDMGHEHCYPAPGFDLAEKYGDLLASTHIHDNHGQSDPHIITWNDDQHLLPFDGTVDFERIGLELKRLRYHGTIMLETALKREVPRYSGMKLEEFLAEAHRAAARIAGAG